jgi:large subunit ribosomal protein L22
MIEAVSRAKHLRGSARKMRRVADLVRGKMVPEALDILKFCPKRAARPLYKTVKSAASNAISEKGSAKVKAEDMRIIELSVDGGPIIPRIRFIGMGRVYRIRKRTCHLTVKISDEGRAELREQTRTKKKSKVKAEAKVEPKADAKDVTQDKSSEE